MWCARVMEFLFAAFVLGVAATATIDLWAVLRQRLFGIPALSYALVGRWLGHSLRGRFHHAAIAASPQVRNERAIGWIAHYLIGILFAAVLLAVCGVEWICRPTLLPALIVGIVSVLAPFLIMQPGMGAGFAASRTPRPGVARLQSLITHAIFGIGLFVSGWIANALGVFRCAPSI